MEKNNRFAQHGGRLAKEDERFVYAAVCLQYNAHCPLPSGRLHSGLVSCLFCCCFLEREGGEGQGEVFHVTA